MAESRFDEILAQVRERYPDQVGIALVEGLPPLARIALTARCARRAMRYFSLQSEFTRKTVEGAIRAAENAASGEPINAEDEQAVNDSMVLRACDSEAREGSKAGADAAMVARLTVRCVDGHELAYGEMAFLASIDVQTSVRDVARSRSLGAGEIEQAVFTEVEGMWRDLVKLVLRADACGEGWVDPALGRSLDSRNDRGWKKVLKAASLRKRESNGIGEKWRLIHQAVRQTGGCFYPPCIFDSSFSAK
jgi:hypothetical protein